MIRTILDKSLPEFIEGSKEEVKVKSPQTPIKGYNLVLIQFAEVLIIEGVKWILKALKH